MSRSRSPTPSTKAAPCWKPPQDAPVVQMGQWRSGQQYQQAVEIVRSGKLGKVSIVRGWAYLDWMKPRAPAARLAPPAGVDYDMWLGPAPKRPFNPNRFHFNFRWFWDYAGGLMTDWGVHLIDIALWVMDAKAPKSRHGLRRQGRLSRRRLRDPRHAPGRVRVRRLQHAVGARHRDRRGQLRPHRGHRLHRQQRHPRREPRRLGAPPRDVGGRRAAAVPDGRASTLAHSATSRRSTFTPRTSSRRSGRRTPPSSPAGWRAAASPPSTHTWGTSRSRSAGRSTGTRPPASFKGDAEANARIVPQYHNGWTLPRS